MKTFDIEKNVINQEEELAYLELGNETEIERHDKFTFEVKLDYPIQNYNFGPKMEKATFLMDAFFFIPRALQINQYSYGKNEFFSDLRTDLRFKTPQMALSGILDPNNDRSPLNIINLYLRKIKNGNQEPRNIRKIKYELRLLGCITRASLRDQIERYLHNCDALTVPITKSKLMNDIEMYMQKILSLQYALIKLSGEIMETPVPVVLKESFRFMRDYISYFMEQFLTSYLKHIDYASLPKECSDTCIRIIKNELNYRKTENSYLLQEVMHKNETFTYWLSILKKYVQSILYLERKPSKSKGRWMQVFYSLAAGIAMLASVAIGFIISWRFEENSWPFIISLIIAYMFKDRIKDTIRLFSDRAVSVVYPDRKTNIVDPQKEVKIGYSKETVRFIPISRIPHKILHLREISNRSVLEKEGKLESIIHYKKHLVIKPAIIEDIHRRVGDIHDILRFNIRHVMQYADDPLQTSLRWDENSEQVIDFEHSKVYHLNIIFKLGVKVGDQSIGNHYLKCRVIMDRKGIKRLEIPKVEI